MGTTYTKSVGRRSPLAGTVTRTEPEEKETSLRECKFARNATGGLSWTRGKSMPFKSIRTKKKTCLETKSKKRNWWKSKIRVTGFYSNSKLKGLMRTRKSGSVVSGALIANGKASLVMKNLANFKIFYWKLCFSTLTTLVTYYQINLNYLECDQLCFDVKFSNV